MKTPTSGGIEAPVFRFERIEAWQMARSFNRVIYSVSKSFPKDEVFSLTSQLRRSAVSVAANIAEGSGRNSDADFGHFLEIAYASLMETVSHLYLALDQNYLPAKQFEDVANEANALACKIVALSKSIRRSPRISRP